MDAGGYVNERWWTDEGWAWATFSKRCHPEFWIIAGDDYYYRTMLKRNRHALELARRRELP